MFRVEIKNPCNENWNAMTPQEQGRFCSSCQLVVIDFTDKTPQEISNILASRTNQATCGNFNSWDVKSDSKIDGFIWKLKTKGFKYAAVFVLSALFLFGCRTRRGRTAGPPVYNQSPRNLDDIEVVKDSINFK